MIEKCICIGRGGSLRDFDFDIIKNVYKISVNGFHGNPDCIVFIDNGFITSHPEVYSFRGEIHYGEKSGFVPHSFDHHKINHRHGARDNNSGFEAVKIALLKARKVYLIGYDFSPTGYLDTEKVHPCYADTAWIERRVARFRDLPRERIINCSPGPLNFFESIDIKKVFKN